MTESSLRLESQDETKHQHDPHIFIRPQPFNTLISYRLVLALDQELAAMYPDWDDLPHPNLRTGNNPAPHEGNLLREETPRPIILDFPNNGEDGGPGPVAPGAAPDASVTSMQTATHDGTASYADLKFFVAFDTGVPASPSLGPAKSVPGKPVGCVAINPMPWFPAHHAPEGSDIASPPTATVGELKRMYVEPSHRGTGISKLLLRYAETFARNEMNLDKLVLETGIRQKASVKLYEHNGWKYCEMFGDWAGAGPENGGVSVCMERVLR